MNQSPLYKKEVIATVGFLILNLLVLLSGSWFLMSKIIEGSGELKEKKGALVMIEQNWQEIKVGQDTAQRIKPELAEINQSFISIEEPIKFINALENLAQKTNNLFEISLITLNDITAGPQESDFLPFQIYLGGSFSNLMHFLNYLETMEYYVRIESMQISQSKLQDIGRNSGKEAPPDSVYSIINLKVFANNGN